MPNLHVLFDFLPRGRLMVIHIQGLAIEYVSPVFFGFLTETAGDIFAVESMIVGAGVPVTMAELDDIHLMILR
jgi:hypothetical protein